MQLTQLSPSQRESRWVHPLAWWSWGLSAAVVAILSNSFITHVLVFTAILTVLITFRSTRSWSNAIGLLIRLAIFIVLFRIVIELIFGVHFGGPVLMTLPVLDLPSWLGGISLGGKVGSTGLIAAIAHGFKLATVIIAASAAAALVPPSLLLKSLPNAVYEAGLVTVIALGFLPALSADAKRLKTAAALRGRPARKIRHQLALLFPLIENSLNRAVTLANAMESKGFGRIKTAKFNNMTVSIILIAGMMLMILATTSLLRNPLSITNLTILVLAISLIAISVALSGKLKLRTVYRNLEFSQTEFSLLVFAMLLVMASALLNTNELVKSLVIFGLLLSPIIICPKPPGGLTK
jgi:energy-coupling factor transport system permease protein